MNERIKELAEQAGFRSDVTVSDGNGNHIETKTELSLEKFAELIIKETQRAISFKNYDVMNRGGRLSVGDIQRLIDNHFGVES